MPDGLRFNNRLLAQRLAGSRTRVGRSAVRLSRPTRRRLERERQEATDAGPATRISILPQVHQGSGSVAMPPDAGLRVGRRFPSMGESGLTEGWRSQGRRKADEVARQAPAGVVPVGTER